MKTPHEKYQEIIDTTPNELCQKIMKILEYAYYVSPGKNVTKHDMILNIFGIWIDPKKLSSSNEDRQIRLAVAELQLQGYPVIASSGKAGYRLEIEDEKIEAYCVELESRIAQLQAKCRALRHPAKKYVYQPPQVFTQAQLI